MTNLTWVSSLVSALPFVGAVKRERTDSCKAEDGLVPPVTGSRRCDAVASGDGTVAKLAHSSLASSVDFALQACPAVHDPKRVTVSASTKFPHGPVAEHEACHDGGVNSSKATYGVGIVGVQGHPNKAEDFASSIDLSAFSAFASCQRACLAFIVDGHGGTDAVRFIAQRFPELLLQRLAALRSAPQATMANALLEVDEELVQQDCSAGAVMCAMLLVDDTVTYVNTGDCRLVLFDWAADKATQVTEDHNLLNCAERKRASDAGAQLSGDGCYVVLQHKDGSQQDLGVTRALGHACIKNYHAELEAAGEKPTAFRLRAQPEPGEFKISAQHILIAGCDGLYEPKADTNGQLARYVRRTLADTNCAHAAAAAAVMRALDMGSRDNITAIVMHFGRVPPAMTRANSVLKNLQHKTSFASSSNGSLTEMYSLPEASGTSLLTGSSRSTSAEMTPAASAELPGSCLPLPLLNEVGPGSCPQ